MFLFARLLFIKVKHCTLVPETQIVPMDTSRGLVQIETKQFNTKSHVLRICLKLKSVHFILIYIFFLHDLGCIIGPLIVGSRPLAASKRLDSRGLHGGPWIPTHAGGPKNPYTYIRIIYIYIYIYIRTCTYMYRDAKEKAFLIVAASFKLTATQLAAQECRPRPFAGCAPYGRIRAMGTSSRLQPRASRCSTIQDLWFKDLPCK